MTNRRSLILLGGSELLTFQRVAPAGLSAPAYVVSQLQRPDRSWETLLQHGFSTEQLNVKWWADHGVQIQFPDTSFDPPRLTRGSLFKMAQEVTADDDDALLGFLWHVLAWGSGMGARNNNERITNCETNVARLWEAFFNAKAGDPRAAYGTLIRKGGAKIRGLGPSFFSKFLYFSSQDASENKCLILVP